MRKFILFLAIGILFQSCFTYRTVEKNPETFRITQKYKILHEGKTSKITVLRINDSTLVFKKNFKEQEVAIDSITAVKKREFSVVKTVIVVPIVVLTSLAIFIAIALSNLKFEFGKFQSPP